MDVTRRMSLAVLLSLLLGSMVSCWAADPIIAQQKVDDRVHDFELPIVGSDDFLRLSDEYRNGPVVVVVLRGYPRFQCQICSRQAATLANRASALKASAARVILVYPGDSSSLKQHAERFASTRRMPDPLVVVRDDGMETIKEWGLRWDGRYETAYPATYVIDRNGRIRWKKVSRSHAGRSTTEEILKELRKL